jgi:hypothetical protein
MDQLRDIVNNWPEDHREFDLQMLVNHARLASKILRRESVGLDEEVI